MATLSFDNYSNWFKSLENKIQTKLKAHDLSPELVQEAYLEKANDPDVRQRTLNRFKSAIEYQAWILSADEATKRQLKNEGITFDRSLGKGKGIKALLSLRIPGDDHVVLSNQNEEDVADSSAHVASGGKMNHKALVDEQSSSFDLIDEIEDPRSAELVDRFGVNMETAEAIRDWIDEQREIEIYNALMDRLKTIVAILLHKSNVKISTAGLAFAARLATVNGLRSQRFFSKKIGCSPSAISKEARMWKEMLDLPENPNLKPDDSIEGYRECQSGDKHWRNKKYTASQ